MRPVMRISIAMATYNGAQFVLEQLESFVAQTRRPDQLVLSDDASTDETLEIVERFKSSAPFEVVLLRNRLNSGHERNFEKAISACTGDLIFLSDQDDVWLPTKIATVAEVFDRKPSTLLVVNDLELANEKLECSGKSLIGQIRASGTWNGGRSLVIGCASAFRGELKSLILPVPPLYYGHDRWIHAVAHALGGRYVLGQTLQLFRRHGNNASDIGLLFDGTGTPGLRLLISRTASLDMRSIYEGQREVLRTIEVRLLKNSRACVGDWRSSREAVVELRRAQLSFDRRIQLLSLGAIRRKFLALMMLVRGDYKYFLGWRSFAKDMMR